MCAFVSLTLDNMLLSNYTILRVVSHFSLSVLANETLSVNLCCEIDNIIYIFLAPYEHVLITFCLRFKVFRGNVFYF